MRTVAIWEMPPITKLWNWNASINFKGPRTVKMTWTNYRCVLIRWAKLLASGCKVRFLLLLFSHSILIIHMYRNLNKCSDNLCFIFKNQKSPYIPHTQQYNEVLNQLQLHCLSLNKNVLLAGNKGDLRKYCRTVIKLTSKKIFRNTPIDAHWGEVSDDSDHLKYIKYFR